MNGAPPPHPDPRVQRAVAAWRLRLRARLAAIAEVAEPPPPAGHDPLRAALAAWRRRLAARLDAPQDVGEGWAIGPVETDPGPPATDVRRGRRRSS